MANELERLQRLNGLLPKLSQSDAKFAQSLMDGWRRFKKLSEKQWEWVDKLIARAELPPEEPEQNVIVIPGFNSVEKLLIDAKKSIAWPAIRLETPEGVKIILRPAKGVTVKWESQFRRIVNERMEVKSGVPIDVLLALMELTKDPVETAMKYGKKTGNCCFCGLTLVAKPSLAVGYGPICAENYGLPWGETSPSVDTKEVEEIMGRGE